MPWVKFRSKWTRKGRPYGPGEEAEVEDWEWDQLRQAGKARALTAEELAARQVAQAEEPSDADLLAAELGEDEEEEGPRYKAGSVPEDADEPPAAPRRSRAGKAK